MSPSPNRPPESPKEAAAGLAPVIYLPHGGGPLPLLGDPAHRSLIDYLSKAGPRIGAPRALVIVSAHWEADEPRITGSEKPGLLYDYHGFPPESYQIDYPLRGNPDLAELLASLVESAGLSPQIDEARPFDHGVFVPLKLMFPEAAIPCVQLSLLRGLDPAKHVAMGRAISTLREKNIAIIGSGMSYHNLRALGGGGAGVDESRLFHDWLVESCCDERLSPRNESNV